MTTTAINDISDLARILKEHPEWAETMRSLLLTRELVELPEKVAQLTERVDRLILWLEEFVREQRETNRELREQQQELKQRHDEFIREQQALGRRLDAFIQEQREINRELRDEQQELKQRHDEFIREQREINRELREERQELGRRLDEFIREQRETNRELREFNQEQREINRDSNQRLIRLEEIAVRSEERFTKLETETGQLRIQVGNLENHVGHLRGEALESRLSGNIRPLVCQRFGLRWPAILKSRFISLDPALYEQLYAAESGGVITEDQILQLEQADFILSAQRKETRAALYLVVEVSRTINDGDITRASSRAATLAAATGTETLALVVGNFIPAPQERRARELQVAVLQRPETED